MVMDKTTEQIIRESCEMIHRVPSPANTKYHADKIIKLVKDGIDERDHLREKIQEIEG